MYDLLVSNPLAFLISFPILVLAIVVHEFAHAFVADKLGDPTPRVQGRVTLDPRAHLDPLGTLMLFLFRFGWGKPVIFDPYNLREPIRDGALIALAGPLSNIVMAASASLLLHFFSVPLLFSEILQQFIFINCVLATFNLVPIHPLDGSKIILAILPKETAQEYESIMHQYGMWLLLFFLIPWNGSSPISTLMQPLLSFLIKIFL